MSASPARLVDRRHFETSSPDPWRRTERGRGHATITDVIPLLVYRYTREELLYSEPEHLTEAA
jgi:hypothetical protein